MNHKLVLKNNFFADFPSKITLLPSPYYKDNSILNNTLNLSYSSDGISSPLVFEHNNELYSLVVGNLGEVSMYLHIDEMKEYIKSINENHNVKTVNKFFNISRVRLVDTTVELKDVNFVASQKSLWESSSLEYQESIAFFKLKKLMKKNGLVHYIPDYSNPDMHIYLLKDININPLSLINKIGNEKVNLPNHLTDRKLSVSLSSENYQLVQYFIDEVLVEVHWNNLYIGDILLSRLNNFKHVKHLSYPCDTIKSYDTNLAEVINPNLLHLPVSDFPLCQSYNITPDYTYNRTIKTKDYRIRLIRDIYTGIHDLDTLMNPKFKSGRDTLLEACDIDLEIDDVESKLFDVLLEYIINSKEIILCMNFFRLKDYYNIDNSQEAESIFLDLSLEEKAELYKFACTDKKNNLLQTGFPHLLGYLLGRTGYVTQSLFIPKDISMSDLFSTFTNPIGLL